MSNVLDQTAYLEGEDPLAHHICQINQDNEIKIPTQIMEGIGLTDPEEIAVESASDDSDVTVLFHPSEDRNTEEVRKDDEGHYWISLENGFENAEPFDMQKNVPHLVMGCGEIWVLSDSSLWSKLSHKVNN